MVFDVADPKHRIEKVRDNRKKKLLERSVNKSRVIAKILENDEVLRIKKVHQKEKDRLSKYKHLEKMNLDDDIVNIED